jgi:hypothetical protein
MEVRMVLDEQGKIALGERYAGRPAVLEELEPGVWVVKLGEAIPENELWLHTPEAKAKLDRALAYAEAQPPQETDLDELEKRLFGNE